MMNIRNVEVSKRKPSVQNTVKCPNKESRSSVQTPIKCPLVLSKSSKSLPASVMSPKCPIIGNNRLSPDIPRNVSTHDLPYEHYIIITSVHRFHPLPDIWVIISIGSLTLSGYHKLRIPYIDSETVSLSYNPDISSSSLSSKDNHHFHK